MADFVHCAMYSPLSSLEFQWVSCSANTPCSAAWYTMCCGRHTVWCGWHTVWCGQYSHLYSFHFILSKFLKSVFSFSRGKKTFFSKKIENIFIPKVRVVMGQIKKKLKRQDLKIWKNDLRISRAAMLHCIGAVWGRRRRLWR